MPARAESEVQSMASWNRSAPKLMDLQAYYLQDLLQTLLMAKEFSGLKALKESFGPQVRALRGPQKPYGAL